jgi:hypothetical protein
MGRCGFDVIQDRFTRRLRPCRMRCGNDAFCFVHSPRQHVNQLTTQMKLLTTRLELCDEAIKRLQHVAVRPGPPPPPPSPPQRTPFQSAHPLAGRFGVPEGRSLANIMKCKPPFNAYSNTAEMLLQERDKVDWAVTALLALRSAIQGVDQSRRLEHIRRYFCSDRVRVGQVIGAHEISQWLQSLSSAVSQNEVQAELRSVLARQNSISNDEIFYR